MAKLIPKSSQKRLLRLISARTDMLYSSDAFNRLKAAKTDHEKYHLLLSMVLCYCRPFTNNHGIGSLLCEYPTFPDFEDADLNERHRHMSYMRNNFLGHSSIQGTRVWLLAPGAQNPNPAKQGVAMSDFGYEIAKLHFFKAPEYAFWLHEVVRALLSRLDTDIAVVCKEIGSNYLEGGEFSALDSGEPFKWPQE